MSSEIIPLMQTDKTTPTNHLNNLEKFSKINKTYYENARNKRLKADKTYIENGNPNTLIQFTRRFTLVLGLVNPYKRALKEQDRLNNNQVVMCGSFASNPCGRIVGWIIEQLGCLKPDANLALKERKKTKNRLKQAIQENQQLNKGQNLLSWDFHAIQLRHLSCHNILSDKDYHQRAANTLAAGEQSRKNWLKLDIFLGVIGMILGIAMLFALAASGWGLLTISLLVSQIGVGIVNMVVKYKKLLVDTAALQHGMNLPSDIQTFMLKLANQHDAAKGPKKVAWPVNLKRFATMSAMLAIGSGLLNKLASGIGILFNYLSFVLASLPIIGIVLSILAVAGDVLTGFRRTSTDGRIMTAGKSTTEAIEKLITCLNNNKVMLTLDEKKQIVFFAILAQAMYEKNFLTNNKQAHDTKQ